LLAGWALVALMNPFERLIFFPERGLPETPAVVGLRFEDAAIRTDDGVKLHAWWIPGRRPESLLWMHGNAGNISHRIDQARLLHQLVGAGVLMLDYRGYGRSAGAPSEAGLYADARAALRFLRGRSDVVADRIFYFGQSLGSAVAIDLAAEEPPRALIIEAPFTSIRAMASTIVPGPLARIVPNSFDNLAKIGRIRCPILIVHGDRDEIVPYQQGRELFAAAHPPKAFYTVRGAGHNDTYVVGGEVYFQRLRELIDKQS
jgi:fermentation-respiration switch protein FrsA (DUF1100 family)